MKAPPSLAAEPPYLVLRYPNNPVIRIDARAVDRIGFASNGIRFDVGEVSIALEVLEGDDSAREAVLDLEGYARTSPLHDQRIIEDARARLANAVIVPLLSIDNEPVRVVGDALLVTGLHYGLEEVDRCAETGGCLYLRRGEDFAGAIQCELALLAVAAHFIDDQAKLAERIADYERRVPLS